MGRKTSFTSVAPRRMTQKFFPITKSLCILLYGSQSPFVFLAKLAADLGRHVSLTMLQACQHTNTHHRMKLAAGGHQCGREAVKVLEESTAVGKGNRIRE